MRIVYLAYFPTVCFSSRCRLAQCAFRVFGYFKLLAGLLLDSVGLVLIDVVQRHLDYV
jgi:hypothetical protein